MTTGPYRVEEVEDAGNATCTCENCGWTGTAEQVCDVGDCSLTPGDASPVGRCPECDGLAYLDNTLRPQGRAGEYACNGKLIKFDGHEASTNAGKVAALVANAVRFMAQNNVKRISIDGLAIDAI